MQSERIPAWRRLGLELKNSSASTPERASKRQKKNGHSPEGGKQDLTGPTNGAEVQPGRNQVLNGSSASHEAKGEGESGKFVASAVLATAQSSETSETDAAEVSKDKRLQRKREARENRRHQEAAASTSEKDGTRSYISYLQVYHHDRSRWKFNKSLQTALLRDCLNLYRVPPELDGALLEYISGLQGQGARIRLAEEAKKILEEPDSSAAQLPTTHDMKYTEAPAGLSPKDVKDWESHMANKRKFYEQWSTSNAPEVNNPEAAAKKRDFEEFMVRLRKTGAAEDGLKQEQDYNKLRRHRAQEILNAVSVLMNAMIADERRKRDQMLLAVGKPTKPKNDEFAPRVINKSKKSRGRKRRTAASTSSSSDSDSSSEPSDSDDG